MNKNQDYARGYIDAVEDLCKFTQGLHFKQRKTIRRIEQKENEMLLKGVTMLLRAQNAEDKNEKQGGYGQTDSK